MEEMPPLRSSSLRRVREEEEKERKILKKLLKKEKQADRSRAEKDIEETMSQCVRASPAKKQEPVKIRSPLLPH